MNFFLISAPTGSPQNLTVISTNPRNMLVAWQPVPEEEVNGPITSYIVRYMSDSPSLINKSTTVSVTSNDVVITESVFPWRLYTVTLSAVNEAGEGPFSEPVTFLTAAEGIYIYFLCLFFYLCLSLNGAHVGSRWML